MKKLDRFILGSYFAPFFRSFGVALFILVLQFLSRYKDEIFGKGLKLSVLLEIFSYAMVSLVVLALPVSVLLSSLMTMGNFGQTYELAAMRASGVSLPRILRPMFIATILISIFSFLLSNYVVTVANLKFHSLLYDVKQVKPTFTLQPGHFYSDIDNYVIRIEDKDLKKEMLYGVIIYDHTQRRGNDKIILADSGKMTVDEERLFMEMTLFNGVSHEMNKTISGNKEIFQNSRYYFDTLYYEFDLSGFGMNRTPEELFATHQYMLNLSQLQVAKDSIQRLKVDIQGQYKTRLAEITHLDSVFSEKAPIVFGGGRIIEFFPKEKAVRIYQKAKEGVKNALNLTADAQRLIQEEVRSLRDYDIEYHGKFALPFSCLIFLLIGAPLGAIIRKGGIGMPIIISVVFYLLFYVLMLQGKKMAQEGVVAVWIGVWLPVMIMTPLAMFVMYESTAERKTMDRPVVYRSIAAIQAFFIAINPITLLLRIRILRQAAAGLLRFTLSLNPARRRAARGTSESPIMERLRKLREKRSTSTTTTAETSESPIERRLREIQARKEKETQQMETGQKAVESAPSTETKQRVTTRKEEPAYGTMAEYKPGLIGRLLAIFGWGSAKDTLPGESMRDRRFRRLREKQIKQGNVIPPFAVGSGAPSAKPADLGGSDETETPIARRLRELRERKAAEGQETGAEIESKAPESQPAIDPNETPIEKRLRELRERKAREAAEAEKTAPIEQDVADVQEAPEEKPAPEKKPAPEVIPEPEKKPATQVGEETPIMRTLRELRERKAREAAENAAEPMAEVPLLEEKTNSISLDWGDMNELRADVPEEETAFSLNFLPIAEAENIDQETASSGEPMLTFDFPAEDLAPIAAPELDAESGSLNFDFGLEAQSEPSEEALDESESRQEPSPFEFDLPSEENPVENTLESEALSENEGEKLEEISEQPPIEAFEGESEPAEPIFEPELPVSEPEIWEVPEEIQSEIIADGETEAPEAEPVDIPVAQEHEQELEEKPGDLEDAIEIVSPVEEKQLPVQHQMPKVVEQPIEPEVKIEPKPEKPELKGPWVETISFSGVPKAENSSGKTEEKERKSWFSRIFGGKSEGKSGNSRQESKEETPIARRLREIQEKKARDSQNGDNGK